VGAHDHDSPERPVPLLVDPAPTGDV
jgi:hypothetical protein